MRQIQTRDSIVFWNGVAAVFTSLLILCAVFFLVPTWIEQVGDYKEWRSNLDAVTVANSRAGRLDEIEGRVQWLEEYVSRFSSNDGLVSQTEWLEYIQTIANEVGLIQVDLRPLPAESSDTPHRFIIDVTLLGSYLSLGKFIAVLENGPVPIRLTSLTLMATGEKRNTLSAEMKLELLSLADEKRKGL